MIIPSIDLQNGHAVQLIGGREKVLDAGDPRPIAERFGRVKDHPRYSCRTRTPGPTPTGSGDCRPRCC